MRCFLLVVSPSLILHEKVVSASSDGIIKAWNPHSPTTHPTIIGKHQDYVKCLAQRSATAPHSILSRHQTLIYFQSCQESDHIRFLRPNHQNMGSTIKQCSRRLDTLIGRFGRSEGLDIFLGYRSDGTCHRGGKSGACRAHMGSKKFQEGRKGAVSFWVGAIQS